jgi:glutaminase
MPWGNRLTGLAVKNGGGSNPLVNAGAIRSYEYLGSCRLPLESGPNADGSTL